MGLMVRIYRFLEGWEGCWEDLSVDFLPSLAVCF